LKETLFFNRVPKVGSQTVMDLIRRLSTRNDFTFHKDGTQKTETVKLTYYEEVAIKNSNIISHNSTTLSPPLVPADDDD
jgi:hypothetical protein